MSLINESSASNLDNNNSKLLGDPSHDCKLKHMLNANNNNNNDNNIDFEKLTCECKNQMDAKTLAAKLAQAQIHDARPAAQNSSSSQNQRSRENVFTLKRWNLVAMWSWDVECEVCAICRTPLMGMLSESDSFLLFNKFLRILLKRFMLKMPNR
jgi:hypothetical protein